MTITKTVVPAKTKAKPAKVHLIEEKSPITLKAEEFVLLHQSLTQMGAFTMVKEYEALKKQLQEYAIANAPDDAEPYTFDTEKGQVNFKPRTQNTVVTDREAMRKALTQKVFNEIASVTLGDLTTYLSALELANFTEKVAGSRALASVVPKE